jgi:two-component system response regulator AtoC
VRELENNIKRLVILGNEAQLIAELNRKRENATFQGNPESLDNGGIQRGQGDKPIPRRIPSEFHTESEERRFDPPDKATLKEVAKIAQRNAEKNLIERVLQQTRWNRRKAAQILDISYKALLYKIKECGLNQE